MERADAAEPNPPERPAEGADRLGQRTVGRGADGLGVETFAVCPALSERHEFCAALAAARIAGERGGRGLSRLVGLNAPAGRDAGSVLLHQEWVAGERLAAVAARRRRFGRTFSAGHLLFILREAAAALRVLHGRGGGWCHGALSPHRVLLTADDRLLIGENVLGPGLAAVGAPPEWLAERLGLAVPVVPGVPSFTPLTDQLQLGRLAVELLVGTTPAFEAGELRAQVDGLSVGTAEGLVAPLDGQFRAVLARMLLLSTDGPFRSMVALERALDGLVTSLPECRPVVPPVEPDELPPAAPARRGPTGQHPAFVVTTNAGEELDRGAAAVPRVPLAASGPPVASLPSPSALRIVPTSASPRDGAPHEASAAPPVAGTSGDPVSALLHGALPSTPDEARAPTGAAIGGHRDAPPPTLLFGVEEPEPPAAPRFGAPGARVRGRARPDLRAWVVRAVVGLGLVAAVATGAWLLAGAWQRPEVPPSGWLRLESKPAGAAVTVDGQSRGQTPLTLSVPAGAYRVEFALGGETRAITVPVTASGEAFQLVSLYPAGPPGTLVVDSVPSAAAVTLDGQPRGRTPLELSGVAPGEHALSVENAVARVEQTIEVLAGARVPVSVPLSGAIAIDSPFEVTVSDGAKALGRTQRGTVAVPAGARRLTFANTTLNYEEVRDVEVQAGRTSPVVLRPPNGVLNLEADTSAQVFLDGKPLGLTPLPNVAVSLGTHEVLFRDARGAEVRYVIVVALGPAYRLRATLLPPSSQRAPVRRRR